VFVKGAHLKPKFDGSGSQNGIPVILELMGPKLQYLLRE
jgi:hypothetical protein